MLPTVLQALIHSLHLSWNGARKSSFSLQNKWCKTWCKALWKRCLQRELPVVFLNQILQFKGSSAIALEFKATMLNHQDPLGGKRSKRTCRMALSPWREIGRVFSIVPESLLESSWILTKPWHLTKMISNIRFKKSITFSKPSSML